MPLGVKVAYSTTPNLERIIAGLNAKKLNDYSNNTQPALGSRGNNGPENLTRTQARVAPLDSLSRGRMQTGACHSAAPPARPLALRSMCIFPRKRPVSHRRDFPIWRIRWATRCRCPSGSPRAWSNRLLALHLTTQHGQRVCPPAGRATSSTSSSIMRPLRMANRAAPARLVSPIFV